MIVVVKRVMAVMVHVGMMLIDGGGVAGGGCGGAGSAGVHS